MANGFIEINIDGLIGPTHHFGGLGVGNVASQTNATRTSNPRAAALEGVAKMELLASLGVPQYFLLPPARPNLNCLAAAGFQGTSAEMLERCGQSSPSILSAVYSSSFMWTANAATVAPTCDTLDGCLHLVPANLCSSLHRGQEAKERQSQLKDLFSGVDNVVVHQPLPSVYPLRDEGAANHMRLCSSTRDLAIHVFVHGPSAETNRFMIRHTKQASHQACIAMQLDPQDCVFIEQSPEAIDAGVFHNDVISTSHNHLLIYHESAFVDTDSCIERIASAFHRKTHQTLQAIRVTTSMLSLEDAVKTYLFNSQLVSLDDTNMAMICPMQCQENAAAFQLTQSWKRDPTIPIQEVYYLPLHQSMANGGGPACLRLRAMLSHDQCKQMDSRFRIDGERAQILKERIEQWYPTCLGWDDFLRPDFAVHAWQAVRSVETGCRRHDKDLLT